MMPIEGFMPGIIEGQNRTVEPQDVVEVNHKPPFYS